MLVLISISISISIRITVFKKKKKLLLLLYSTLETVGEILYYEYWKLTFWVVSPNNPVYYAAQDSCNSRR